MPSRRTRRSSKGGKTVPWVVKPRPAIVMRPAEGGRAGRAGDAFDASRGPGARRWGTMAIGGVAVVIFAVGLAFGVSLAGRRGNDQPPPMTAASSATTYSATAYATSPPSRTDLGDGAAAGDGSEDEDGDRAPVPSRPRLQDPGPITFAPPRFTPIPEDAPEYAEEGIVDHYLVAAAPVVAAVPGEGQGAGGRGSSPGPAANAAPKDGRGQEPPFSPTARPGPPANAARHTSPQGLPRTPADTDRGADVLPVNSGPSDEMALPPGDRDAPSDDTAFGSVAPLPAPDAAAAPRPRPESQPEVEPRIDLAALPVPPDGSGTANPPWRLHAVPTAPADGRPRIAVVIDDMGIDRARSSRVVHLPGPLTTAWLSYGHDLVSQTAESRRAGHELLIHVPMEPLNAHLDPGPDVLRRTMGADQIRRQLDGIFARFPGYVGINNHMGSAFTADARGMAVVIAELKRRGLLWLDSRTAEASVGPDLSRRHAVPFAERHVFLDNRNDVAYVRERLQELEQSARHRGYAIGIGHPRDATIEALGGWLPGLARRGLVLVPVSAIVRQREHDREAGVIRNASRAGPGSALKRDAMKDKGNERRER